MTDFEKKYKQMKRAFGFVLFILITFVAALINTRLLHGDVKVYLYGWIIGSICQHVLFYTDLTKYKM